MCMWLQGFVFVELSWALNGCLLVQNKYVETRLKEAIAGSFCEPKPENEPEIIFPAEKFLAVLKGGQSRRCVCQCVFWMRSVSLTNVSAQIRHINKFMLLHLTLAWNSFFYTKALFILGSITSVHLLAGPGICDTSTLFPFWKQCQHRIKLNGMAAACSRLNFAVPCLHHCVSDFDPRADWRLASTCGSHIANRNTVFGVTCPTNSRSQIANAAGLDPGAYAYFVLFVSTIQYISAYSQMQVIRFEKLIVAGQLFQEKQIAKKHGIKSLDTRENRGKMDVTIYESKNPDVDWITGLSAL